MRRIFQSILILSLSFSFVGCASFGQALKDFLGGSDGRKTKRANKRVTGVAKKRQYKRIDHPTLQEQSQLAAGSGSLWIERGQGAYLFTQNTNRLIGDLVNVNIEGHPKDQIETKVKVIENLIARIKNQKVKRQLASQEMKAQQAGGAAAKAALKASAPPAKNAKFSVKTVPSRIKEILKDGSYLVEGDQPFMLGKREYKLVVKGVVRQEDFDDQGISAETLLDPKFDIVTSKRKGTRL